mmetsp:Transcript_54382/g.132008  ORF Transcript_54382/g.132008 Transcript_54382/m.132008 type:complete len:291 (-) Transcript_54382:1505-2377(-)
MASITNPEDVSLLTSMGFAEHECIEALNITAGNVEMAVNHLLSGGAAASSSTSTSIREAEENVTALARGILRGSTSQYGNPEGRSACTCIALTAASRFLSDQSVTSSFLDEMIHSGVNNYRSLRSAGTIGGSSDVEHLSAEEVLSLDHGNIFPVELLPGGIRQGVLSQEMGHPLGLHALLQAIRQQQPVDEWICIVVTKTPESILVCFPPPRKALSSSSSSPEADAFWLIDSHPRPQLGLTSSYAKLHPTLDTLLLSLRSIFPPTQIDDIPEMMAVMYNSFDLYPLRKKK